MATAGSIVIDLLMRTGAFETDSKRAEKRLREMQKVAKQFGAAVGAGVAAAGTALATATYQAIQFADQIEEMSQRLGIGAETLSGWAYAAKLSGSSLDALTNALPKLAKNMAAAQEDGSRLSELFRTLGISTVDAAGNLRDVEDVLPEIADRFRGLNNDSTEAALAMELFGRSGAELLEFLNRGSAGITELTDRARELGIVISDETAARAAEFNDKLDDMKAVAMAVGLQVAERLLPAMIDLVDSFTDLAQEGALAEQIAGRIEATFTTLADSATILDATIRGVILDLTALYKLAEAGQKASFWGGFNFSGAADSLAGAGVARDMAAGQSDRIGGIGAPRAPIVMPWIDPPASGPSPTNESALNDFFRNPTGKTGGKAEKTEAEKAAERLQRAYDQTLESLERQQYMLGKTGEAAQLRYEIEHGALQGLAPELKDDLMTRALILDAEIAAREEAEKQAEIDKQATERFEDMNQAILDQIELIGMSADEQEIWNNLAWAGVDAESARGQEIIKNTELLQEQRAAMEDQIAGMDVIRGATRGLFRDLMDGSKSAKEAFMDFVDSILAGIAEIIAKNLTKQLFGNDGDPGGGMFGDSVGSILGAMFGGGKASGGDVIAGRSFLIGEEGPEMFIPRTAGTILTAEQTASAMGRAAPSGRGDVHFHTIGSTSRRSMDRQAIDARRLMNREAARTS
jgi:hypothetical protein